MKHMWRNEMKNASVFKSLNENFNIQKKSPRFHLSQTHFPNFDMFIIIIYIHISDILYNRITALSRFELRTQLNY